MGISGDGLSASAFEGGTIDDTIIGGTTPAAATITTLRTNTNVGVAGTGVAAVHYGDGRNITAVLTLTNLVVTVGNGATESLALGSLIYTLPAGNISITRAFCNVNLDGITITNETPEFGLGTVIGVGAASNLGTPSTFENIMQGAAVPDSNGTAYINDVTTLFNILTAAAHTVHANWADAWNVNTDDSGLVNGTVVLEYRFNEA